MPRIIIDTDSKNEIDDQFAMTHAIGCEARVPGVKVIGIVNVQNHNAHKVDSVGIYQEETRQILEALGRSDVPNLRGVPEPIPDRFTPGSSEGIDFIIESARADDPEPLFVIGIGPATDLASAVMSAPDIATKATFVWLGGHLNGDLAAKHGEECNKMGDPWAAKVLFESVDLVHVPALGVTQKLIWNTDDLVPVLRKLGKPIHMLLANRVEEFMAPRKGKDKAFWDTGAVDFAIHPEWYDVVRQPGHGFAEDDARWVIPPTEPTREIRFVKDLDADGILGEAMSVLESL